MLYVRLMHGYLKLNKMKLIRSITVFTSMLLAVASYGQFRDGVTYEELDDSDNVSSLKEHVRTLSAAHLEGRKAGSEGERIAAKKISDLKNRVKTSNETENALLISIHQNYFEDGRYSGAQVFYNKAGERLSKELQKEFISALNTSGIRQAKVASGIYLMEKVNCPAVLIECGFLSNPEEAEKL